jgi:acetylornithine deacetylase
MEIINLLQSLIATQSFSKEEHQTAELIAKFITNKGYTPLRKGNNVWVKSSDFDTNKPTILLNSHHDTVKPNAGYTRNPFEPTIEDDKLYGLGSNDAGGALVALLEVFLSMDKKNRAYNIIYAATAEEEISGTNGISAILEEIGEITLGIVGEPTLMQMAIAEKGLVVLDCEAKGMAGHAARNEGINAIYKAIEDIQWFSSYKFLKVSPTLGDIKMTVSMINAGTQHNVVPDTCKFVVDVRTTDAYSNAETVEIIKKHVKSSVNPRSIRLNSSSIPLTHPIVKKGISIGLNYYGSPTLSDQALMPFTTIKIGPGDSARSHSPDEYIYISEIENAVAIYQNLLDGLLLK